MSGIHTEWAIAQLDDFIMASTTSYRESPPGTIGFHSYPTVASRDELVKKAQIVEQILNRVVPGWRKLDADTDRKEWNLHREAALRAREELLHEDEVRMNLGDDAPTISAAGLHPWVWSGAASLWRSGHYRQAVEDALKKVNAETQNKLGRRDVSETDLFNQAFSDSPAASGKPRLRRMTPDEIDTYKSMQRGARSLAEGIYAGIRNPFGHGDPSKMDIDEQVGLEYLAAISVLARWVDDATVDAVL